jgi:citrate synthase
VRKKGRLGSSMAGKTKTPSGLDGVPITETKIGKSDRSGSLVYRGYPIEELVNKAGFEEVAFLVLKGALPNRRELESFSRALKVNSEVDGRVFEVMKNLPSGSHPMDVLRTAVSSLASLDGQNDSVAEQEISIAAKLPVLAANCLRVPEGLPPVKPRDDLSFAANLLRMTSGKEQDSTSAFDLWVFERVLILYMEHDLNASSFTVRVVASTAADPYAAVTSGLASLKGPLHGGANEAVMHMLLELKDPEKAAEYIESALASGRKVTGFGHRVYKQFDPRARYCKKYLAEMIRQSGARDEVFRLCDSLERAMWERKKIPPNLDFYAAPIFYLLGIPIALDTPIFAASRVFGWISHYNEQVEENKLIRPDAIYVGPSGLSYVPLDER